MAGTFVTSKNASSGISVPAYWSKWRRTLGSARIADAPGRGAGGRAGMESLTSGTLAGTGSFRCEECGYVVTLAASDSLPDCPGCGGASFARASLFGPGTRFSRQVPAPLADDDRERWVNRARAVAGEIGEHLAYED